MPQIPTEIISTNFDTSLFGGFLEGFTELFTVHPSTIILSIFSLLFVMFFDTTGTLIPLSYECGFMNDDGESSGMGRAFLGDAIGSIIGTIFGTSTLTAFVESAVGISLGGRTGLTAIIVGILFLLSALFAPVVLSLFTPAVTCTALVIVGILMMSQLTDIDWTEFADIAPVFMTITMMTLTYSISLGIAWGFIVYAVVEIARGNWKKLTWLVWLLVILFIVYLFFRV
jgi:AGZA family xanthine/uracil permease-like MFS transporter